MREKFEPQIDKVDSHDEEADHSEEVEIEKSEMDIEEYLRGGLLESLPDVYKEEYANILYKHGKELPVIEKECKASIVLPAFKEEKLVLEALESLNQQKGVDNSDFEVILVVNYPKEQGVDGKETLLKPHINDYNEDGDKIGEHEDRTFEIAKKFSAKNPDFKLRIIEQSFPKTVEENGRNKEIAGVGIASKLGMDLALTRQKENPGIISYYGTDTTFDEKWVRTMLDSFEDENVDAVRGYIKGYNYYKRVDDVVDGKEKEIVLNDEVMKEIQEISSGYHKYSKLLVDYRNLLQEPEQDEKQKIGLSCLRAKMYAKIKGMQPLRAGEDWRMASDVIEAGGEIFENPKLLATIWGRIRMSGTTGWSEDLRKGYRAWKYGEGIDKDGELEVDSPDYHLTMDKIRKEDEKFYNTIKQGGKVDTRFLEKWLSDKQLNVIHKVAEESDSMDMFHEAVSKELGSDFGVKLQEKIREKFPRIGVSKAISKLQKIMQAIKEGE